VNKYSHKTRFQSMHLFSCCKASYLMEANTLAQHKLTGRIMDKGIWAEQASRMEWNYMSLLLVDLMAHYTRPCFTKARF
jgi:hypothetical protein